MLQYMMLTNMTVYVWMRENTPVHETGQVEF